MTSKELLKRKESFLFITGPAGSGKTYLVRNAISLKPKWGILSATTGAASRVLSGSTEDDVKTINSTLGFFNAESLVRSRDRGTLRKNLIRLKRTHQRIVIDECSMLDAEVFEILCLACEEIGMGIVLTGDFCQLPSISPRPRPTGWRQWIFESPSFAKFKTIRLETQYRQTNPFFLTGLNHLRAG